MLVVSILSLYCLRSSDEILRPGAEGIRDGGFICFSFEEQDNWLLLTPVQSHVVKALTAYAHIRSSSHYRSHEAQSAYLA
jgi:predicted TPR repeat methyltransferase